jgi:DNA-binding NarL/FixJ family response regulator
VPKILIADDSEPMRRFHRQLAAQTAGWTICGEAVNGLQAVQMANALKPDLIVLDLAMPIIDGLRAAVEILKSTPNVPIVLYTLHDVPHIALEAKKVGIREVVFKTADAKELAGVVERLLREIPAHAPSLAHVAPPLFTGTDGEAKQSSGATESGATFETIPAASAPSAPGEAKMSAATESAPAIKEPPVEAPPTPTGGEPGLSN